VLEREFEKRPRQNTHGYNFFIPNGIKTYETKYEHFRYIIEGESFVLLL
jgi:hypothetical protein